MARLAIEITGPEEAADVLKVELNKLCVNVSLPLDTALWVAAQLTNRIFEAIREAGKHLALVDEQCLQTDGLEGEMEVFMDNLLEQVRQVNIAAPEKSPPD